MPILQWLFKSSSRREQCSDGDEGTAKTSRELVIFNKDSNRKESEAGAAFTILLRRDDCRTCFYNTLRLKHLNSLNFGLMGHKSVPVAVGCKVLPICDVASLGSRSSADIGGEGMEKVVQKRRKAISRMKEFVRWAAAAKTGKAGIKGWKVLYYRNKMALKDSLDDASSSKNLSTPPVTLQSSNSNVSELDRQKTEDCRKGGQWITSDSDFVVLEL